MITVEVEQTNTVEKLDESVFADIRSAALRYRSLVKATHFIICCPSVGIAQVLIPSLAYWSTFLISKSKGKH